MNNRKIRATAAAFAIASATLAGGFAGIAPATAAPAVVRTAAPSVGELQAKLQVLLNTGASRSARAAELEAGEAGLPMIDQIAGVMNSVPSFRWSVQGPVSVNGDTLSANLMTTVDGFSPFPAIEVSWRRIDGTWKLTRESECTIGYYASVSCSV
ncbi:hypothetical protein [Nocardia beijingensis]|uniref:hypothetical protein n=1 Tax=Nocardia beijingensis TaxID=95162 RepID=UPI00082CEBD7|nr:hypothetical protein [Nocardia beijingensis]